MNHCIDCGAKVSRGYSPPKGGAGGRVRCLVCETRRLFKGYHGPLTPSQRRTQQRKGVRV